MIRSLTILAAVALASPALAQTTPSNTANQSLMRQPGVSTAVGTQDRATFNNAPSAGTVPYSAGRVFGTPGYGAPNSGAPAYGTGMNSTANGTLTPSANTYSGTSAMVNGSGIGTPSHVQSETPPLSTGRNPSMPATSYGAGNASTLGLAGTASTSPTPMTGTITSGATGTTGVRGTTGMTGTTGASGSTGATGGAGGTGGTSPTAASGSGLNGSASAAAATPGSLSAGHL